MDGESRSVVLPIKMAVTTDAADAADAKAAEALVKPTEAPVDDKEISRDTGMRRFADSPAATRATSPRCNLGTDRSRGALINGRRAGRCRPAAESSSRECRRPAHDSARTRRPRPRRADSAPTDRPLPELTRQRRRRRRSERRAARLARTAGRALRAKPTRAETRSLSAKADAAAKADSAQANARRPAESNNPPPLPAARAPGGEFMSANFIPGYTIHATIGESEKAAVYVATSAARNENVALKVSKTTARRSRRPPVPGA